MRVQTTLVRLGSIFLFLHANWLLAQTQVTNQRLFDTIPFVPDHYPQRIARFEKEPIITGRIIFLGNSITEIGKWDQLLGDSTVINRGISGDISFGILKRLDDIIKRLPSKLFIMIGINDIGKDIPDVVIADNYRKIIRLVQEGSPSTKIFVQSILPVNPDVPNFPQHYDKQEHILSTNKLIQQAALDLHCVYVNLHDLFLDSSGRLDAKYTIDGLHLNPRGEGYGIWINELKTKRYL
jgi:lysophospholipase L1-like esterase